MDDKTLYATLLGLTSPWGVEKVELKLEEGAVHVWVALPPETLWVCPDCLQRAPIHDHRERTWRHLDTFQYRTLLHARVPRLDCPTHGIKQLRLPWAEENSRLTALFEAFVIQWLKVAPTSAVARQLRLSWKQVDGIMQRAVTRGLTRRKAEPIPHLGIDETAFQRRHEYVTVVSNLEETKVLFVSDDRRRESLDAFWPTLSPEQLASIVSVAMDMWGPYIDATKAHVPDAASKIVFDKYHLASHVNRAVDTVRKAEHRELQRQGIGWLKGTKYDWLRHPENFTVKAWHRFQELKDSTLRTARAWAMKETFMCVFAAQTKELADAHFRRWFGWARRSRLEPMRELALMLEWYWPNIRTWFDHNATNAGSESINAKIQAIKFKARGFRNRARFKTVIYFHLGGLDLMPTLLRGSQ